MTIYTPANIARLKEMLDAGRPLPAIKAELRISKHQYHNLKRLAMGDGYTPPPTKFVWHEAAREELRKSLHAGMGHAEVARHLTERFGIHVSAQATTNKASNLGIRCMRVAPERKRDPAPVVSTTIPSQAERDAIARFRAPFVPTIPDRMNVTGEKFPAPARGFSMLGGTVR